MFNIFAARTEGLKFSFIIFENIKTRSTEQRH